jgi:hypothetical protein
VKALACLILAIAAGSAVHNFDANKPGVLPAGWTSALTGAGPQPQWKVQTDPTAPSRPNVLAQTSADKTDYHFPLALLEGLELRDLDLSVQFKAVAGAIDRAAGIAFRLKDADNYYVVRANALENNLRLYHVVGGRRVQFAGANFKVTSGEWHRLRVECAGTKITCWYDGEKKIEATDATFREAGRVGLWTKADSVTYFDDFQVTPR